MPEEVKPSQELAFPEIQSIVKLSQEYLPKMQAASDAYVAEMGEWNSVNDDAQREALNDLLAYARTDYGKIEAMRKEMTKPLDELKKKLMTFEKPLSDDKDSEMSRCRRLLASYDQKKIDEKNRIAAEAAKRKAAEDKRVEVKTMILKRLNDMIASLTTLTEVGSAEYFNKLTLDNFEKKSGDYKSWKPKIKPADYAACFAVPETWIKESPDNEAMIFSLMSQESIEKWTEIMLEAATPIINAWRAKLPQWKEDLEKAKNAASDAERTRLETERQAKEKTEADARNRAIQQQQLAANAQVEQQAELDKLENSFREQAVVQEAPESGPKKLVLKFTDPKLRYKALCSIIYHSMLHKDFPGFEKRDKNKQAVLDEKGKAEYVDAVQWWINFFMSKCDAAIEGTEVLEYSKVIVKK